MLINFKQFPGSIKFIQFTFLTKPLSATSAVMCTSCYRLIKSAQYGMFTKHPVLTYVSPATPKRLPETYDRIPSRRGHATPLSQYIIYATLSRNTLFLAIEVTIFLYQIHSSMQKQGKGQFMPILGKIRLL